MDADEDGQCAQDLMAYLHCLIQIPIRILIPTKWLYFYRPQTEFAKVMLLQVSVCPGGVGVCMAAPGQHVWLLKGGGGMCGCSGGHVWLLQVGGGCAWLLLGAVRGCSGGCMVAPGGHAWLLQGGHAWDMTRYRDMVNEQVVRILLECIFVLNMK